MNKIETSDIKIEQNAGYVIKGIVVSIIFTLISLLIFAALLACTNLTEATIPPVIIVLSAISIFIGSSISTIKIKKNGLLNGAIIGGTYIALIYLISSIVSTGFQVNIYTIIMIICSIIAGIIGGIVGVNIK